MAFLREELRARGMAACADLATIRDGRWVTVPGIVLVRQKPGSAKGVMFITIEDETGVANLILWPSVFERQRRLVLSAGMLGCRGRVQREGEVVHVIAHQLEYLSDLLRSVQGRDGALSPRRGRGDKAAQSDAPGIREGAGPGGRPACAICSPELPLGGGIKVPTRNFR